MIVQVTGVQGVHEMLDDYMAPKLPKRLQDATRASAQVFKKPLQAEARKVSKRMGRDVKVVRAARERPATIVKFGKRAWFDHFVIRGTRDHGPVRADKLVFEVGGRMVRAEQVRGVRPNSMVDRVGAKFERQALDAQAGHPLEFGRVIRLGDEERGLVLGEHAAGGTQARLESLDDRAVSQSACPGGT